MKSCRNHDKLLKRIGLTCKKVNRVWACFQNLCHLLFVFVDESMNLACVEQLRKSNPTQSGNRPASCQACLRKFSQRRPQPIILWPTGHWQNHARQSPARHTAAAKQPAGTRSRLYLFSGRQRFASIDLGTPLSRTSPYCVIRGIGGRRQQP